MPPETEPRTEPAEALSEATEALSEAAEAPTEAVAEISHEQVGQWNRRFGVSLARGGQVEAVLYRGDSLCISTQVGCAVACPFCASGAEGLDRGLSLAELCAQVALVRARGHAPVRVTLSGVGEPLHNFDAVVAFLAWAAGEGLRVSLTTSGGPLPRLLELLPMAHAGVTISVHAGTEATRARLVPKGPALGPLFAALGEAKTSLSRRRHKKVALAYLTVAGQNDSDDEVDAFIERALPLGFAVHLYALNPVPGSLYAPLSREAYEAIYARMSARGLRVRMSSQARIEANGGCGTLVAALRPRR